MRQGSRSALRRGLLALAAAGLLATLGPGCGGPSAGEGATPGVDPVLKKSNDQMENFMKSQMGGKKKRR